jgi:hypothetical protein
MKKEILDNSKSLFGCESSVNYCIENDDNVVELILDNSKEWKNNHSLVTFGEDVFIKLLKEAVDYDINHDGLCKLYLDLSHKNIISISREEELKKYKIDCVECNN